MSIYRPGSRHGVLNDVDSTQPQWHTSGYRRPPDQAIWQYAFDHDFVVVTTNAWDFLHLLNVELHPGLIVLRESGLTRDKQWERLVGAIDDIQRQPDPETYTINQVIEILGLGQILVREIPPPHPH